MLWSSSESCGAMVEELEAARKPYPLGIPEMHSVEARLNGWRGPVTSIYRIQIGSTLVREARTASHRELVRVAALALDHRREHGRFPETLSALSGAEARTDPLTGKPFSMAREGRALFLSSVGEPTVSLRLE